MTAVTETRAISDDHPIAQRTAQTGLKDARFSGAARRVVEREEGNPVGGNGGEGSRHQAPAAGGCCARLSPGDPSRYVAQYWSRYVEQGWYLPGDSAKKDRRRIISGYQ